MQLESFRRWIHQIYTTRDEEMDCEGLSRVLPQYVDMEIAGEPVDRRFPEVKRHLSQCTECCDLYHALHDAALLESQPAASESAELERL